MTRADYHTPDLIHTAINLKKDNGVDGYNFYADLKNAYRLINPVSIFTGRKLNLKWFWIVTCNAYKP